MYPRLAAGARIEAKATSTNRSCGVNEKARGRIVFVGGGRVSISIERGHPGVGFIDATCTTEVLANNFEVGEYDIHLGYVRSGHQGGQYPEEYVGTQ